MVQPGVVEQRAAGQHPAGLEHPHHLDHRPRRVGEAVQPGERDDQVERAVLERQVADVGEPRPHLVGHTTPLGGAHRPVEHGLGDVGGDVLHALAGLQPAQRDAAAARDVEHPRSGRLPADLGRGVVAAAAGRSGCRPATSQAAAPPVLDRPVVEVRPERVVVPAAEAGLDSASCRGAHEATRVDGPRDASVHLGGAAPRRRGRTWRDRRPADLETRRQPGAAQADGDVVVPGRGRRRCRRPAAAGPGSQRCRSTTTSARQQRRQPDGIPRRAPPRAARRGCPMTCAIDEHPVRASSPHRSEQAGHATHAVDAEGPRRTRGAAPLDAPDPPASLQRGAAGERRAAPRRDSCSRVAAPQADRRAGPGQSTTLSLLAPRQQLLGAQHLARHAEARRPGRRRSGAAGGRAPLTSRLIALERGLVSRPCSMNQARSASIDDSACRSQSRLSDGLRGRRRAGPAPCRRTPRGPAARRARGRRR